MIYVRLEGNDFEYEAADVLKLFFENEELSFADEEHQPEGQEIRIVVKLTEQNSQAYFAITLEAPDTGILERHSDEIPIYLSNVQGEQEHRRRLKREMKRALYSLLADYTGKHMPWGILTGIRPVKIAREMLEDGWHREDILKQLKEYYFVSDKKALLLYELAVSESKILSTSAPDMISLYIGIPFCPTRCAYCSFTSNPIDRYAHRIKEYISALFSEITAVSQMIRSSGHKIQSMYIGGGTPTSLDAENLGKLLAFIEDSFDFDSLQEYTLEAGRPDSIDSARLAAIRKSRVDRISINPQTMCDETLQLIGRRHTAADVITAFQLARRTGFDNINMDVIVGLPGENRNIFEETLRQIRELGPESLTVHTMALKRASKLNEDKTRYRFATAREAAYMIELAAEYAESMEMHPYYLYRQKNMVGNLENIGYCRPGKESIYNIQIMEEKQTIIALGPGAVTKVVYPEENRIERIFNVKSVEEYISRIDEMIERKKVLFEALKPAKPSA